MVEPNDWNFRKPEMRGGEQAPVSGDKHAALISVREFKRLAQKVWPKTIPQ
jgi:hypothetical protein